MSSYLVSKKLIGDTNYSINGTDKAGIQRPSSYQIFLLVSQQGTYFNKFQ